MRIRLALGLVLAQLVGGGWSCTDGGDVGAGADARSEDAGAVPRNSDGSPQILPPGPPSRPPHTLVLAYDDFGPQAMAFELLGMEWWQWEGGGSWEPGDRFEVRVVVYRGVAPEAVRAEYPTIEGRADHRIVSYDEALAYLERNMAQIEGDRSLARLHARLAATRAWIGQQLGSAAPP